KITDGAGREVREISGQVLANNGKPGIQSACWDLRVNPNPAPPAEGRGRGAGEGGREGAAAPAGGSASTSPPRPTMFAGFGAGWGADNSSVGRVTQAKNGLMAGMSPTEQTTRAYTEVKTQASKAVADINAVIAKATTVSSALAKYSVTLTVPQPVKAPEPAAPKRTSSDHASR